MSPLLIMIDVKFDIDKFLFSLGEIKQVLKIFRSQ